MKRINPVLLRGLRTRMRGIRALILISVYLVVFTAIFILVYFASRGNLGYYGVSPRPAFIASDMMGTLYTMLTVILFGMVALMVPAMNAGAISSEREKQTLDLLLCTPMSARKIITGKLLSNLTFVIFLVILSAPLFAIVYLFGGLSIPGILRLFLFIMVSAYGCASVAIFFSSLVKRSSMATILSYISLILFVILTLVVGLIQINNYYNNFDYMNNPNGPESYMPLILRINPVVGLLQLSNMEVGSFMEGQGNAINLIHLFLPMDISDTGFQGPILSAAFILVLSVILNILSALSIKPVRKFQRKH